MESILAVALYTLREHIRHRVYMTVILFGLILAGGGAVISSLAVAERMRMLVDVGLGGIEFLMLLTVVFVTVGLVLEEIESRTIYLMLSHPIERWQYIVGRYLGTMLALAAGVLIMAVMHLVSLFLHGWTWEGFYATAVACTIAKIAVVGALALVVSLATTSTASSMTVTGFLWVLGHFSSELSFMGEKSLNPLIKAAVWVFRHVAPNFAHYNYRDFWRVDVPPDALWFAWMGVYSVTYVAAALFITSWLFADREV